MFEEAEFAVRQVGFMAQVTGAELRIYDSAGALIQTKSFREGIRPRRGELGNV